MSMQTLPLATSQQTLRVVMVKTKAYLNSCKDLNKPHKYVQVNYLVILAMV